MKYAILPLFVALTTAFLVEMETSPQNKTCISEFFVEGEPISVSVKVLEMEGKKYSLFVTIENERRALLAHKKYEYDDEKTLLTYNNERDQQITFCIDNFEKYAIYVELDIRYKHHLANLDNAPSVNDYRELDEKLTEIDDIVENSYGYFETNERSIQNVVDQGSYLEGSLTFVGMLSLMFIFGAALLQVAMIRLDIQRKKNV